MLYKYVAHDTCKFVLMASTVSNIQREPTEPMTTELNYCMVDRIEFRASPITQTSESMSRHQAALRIMAYMGFLGACASTRC
jgi:hypothetical protein